MVLKLFSKKVTTVLMVLVPLWTLEQLHDIQHRSSIVLVNITEMYRCKLDAFLGEFDDPTMKLSVIMELIDTLLGYGC